MDGVHAGIAFFPVAGDKVDKGSRTAIVSQEDAGGALVYLFCWPGTHADAQAGRQIGRQVGVPGIGCF